MIFNIFRGLAGSQALLISLFTLPVTPAHAGVIAIVIDDLGYDLSAAATVASLHPNITLAVLPDAPKSRNIADQGSHKGHEIILHIPMQAISSGVSTEDFVLSIDMTERQFKGALRNYLADFPMASGVNNHQGSLLTRHPGYMGWLMEVMAGDPSLCFIDSRTHHKTVAGRIAHEHAIGHASRDVFLDHENQGRKAIWKQVHRLDRLARRNGHALAIGHPHSHTLAVLRQAIPWLESRGHQITPVSRYVQLKEEGQCPACSFHSLKVVKSSKP